MILRFLDRNGVTYLLRDPEVVLTKRGDVAFEFPAYKVEGRGGWEDGGLLPLERAVEWGFAHEQLELVRAAA